MIEVKFLNFDSTFAANSLDFNNHFYNNMYALAVYPIKGLSPNAVNQWYIYDILNEL